MANASSLRRKMAGHSQSSSLESQIFALAKLPISRLRQAWEREFACDAPPVRSPLLLRQLFAWKLQEDEIVGLDRTTERELTKIADALRRDGSYEPNVRNRISPGVVLSREWKGVVHRVTAVSEGFDYRGKRYRSLSDIARTITGTRWSGPRFFGLEQKQQRSSREIAS